jgi:hypothetical protein
MPTGGIDDLSRSLLQSSNQIPYVYGDNLTRNIYPAIVVSVDDPLDQNRIIARIINIDNEGKVLGGRDKDVPDNKLPICIPCGPEHIHVRPLVGEMVLLFLENPSDNSAPRYWSGPIISSKLKLKNQEYKEAVKIMDYTDFSVNKNTKKDAKVSTIFPEQADVAIQGRDDADLILRPKEATLIAGKFKTNTTEQNTETPSYIKLKQISNGSGSLKNFSQTTIVSTNINIYSPRGKFRGGDLKRFETNTDLSSFGDLANSLHPAVFGDELIKLFEVLIRFLTTHIHTPQSPPTPTPDFATLQMYTVSGELQKLISKHVRIN